MKPLAAILFACAILAAAFFDPWADWDTMPRFGLSEAYHPYVSSADEKIAGACGKEGFTTLKVASEIAAPANPRIKAVAWTQTSLKQVSVTITLAAIQRRYAFGLIRTNPVPDGSTVTFEYTCEAGKVARRLAATSIERKYLPPYFYIWPPNMG